jgi:maltooligosyltrehalose trehalohydrolase
VLHWDEAHEGIHDKMLSWYQELIALRRSCNIAKIENATTNAQYDNKRNLLLYSYGDLLVCCNFGNAAAPVPEAAGMSLLLASTNAVRAHAPPTLNADEVAVWSDAPPVERMAPRGQRSAQ